MSEKSKAEERQEIIADLEAQGMSRGMAKHLTFGWEFVGPMHVCRLRGSEPSVQNLAPVRPHPIVKLGAEIAAEIGPAEAQARRELGRLAARWAKKTTRPLLVSADLRAKGALWRLKGAGAC